MRKRGIIGVLIVSVVALGVTGGIVLAQENGTGDDTPMKSFVARVAEALGLEESQVQDAFDTAGREMEDEAIDRKLAVMVEKGKLTQEEADEIKAWNDSRPDSLSSGFPFGRFGKFKRFGGRRWGGHGMHGFRFHDKADPAPSPEPEGTSL